MHKHVWLVGLNDPVLFKEYLATKLLLIDVHDSDEYL